jgi:hypothetical protein
MMDTLTRQRAMLMLEMRKYNPSQARIPEGFKGGGRFRGLKTQLVALLKDWAKGKGDDDPLAGIESDPVKLRTKLLGVINDLRKERLAAGDTEGAARLVPRRGAPVAELKLLLYNDVKADVRGKRDEGKPSAKFNLQGKPDPAKVREVEVDNRIRAAYSAVLARKSNQDNRWVMLSDLRDELGESTNRHEIDAALKRLAISREPGSADVVPEDNQKALLPKDREAAVHFGGTDKHAISFDDPSPRPVPTSHYGKDVAVYRDKDGKPALFREDDSGRRGPLVQRFDSLADMQKWADDNGEPRLAEWARKEQGGKAPAKAVPAKKAAPKSGSLTVEESISHRQRMAEMMQAERERVAPAKRAPAKKAVPAKRPPAKAPELSPDPAVHEIEVDNRIRAAYREIQTDDPAVREVETENRIRAAYAKLRPNGGFVNIADIRDETNDIPREQLDEVLKSMTRGDSPAVRQSGWRFIPIANSKALSDREYEASLRHGGERLDAISMRDPSPRPLPAKKTADHVMLSDLRRKLDDLPRADVDAALTRMNRGDYDGPGDPVVVPQSNQKALTQADRDAAVHVGGQDKHAIRFNDPSPRPLPAPAKKATPQTAPAKSARPTRIQEIAAELEGVSDGEKHGRLREMGFTDHEANVLLDRPQSMSDIAAEIDGLPRAQQHARLVALGFSRDEANGILGIPSIPANKAAPAKLTPAQAERELDSAEDWVQAARDGRISRPAAARRIRQMAQKQADSAGYIGLGDPRETWSRTQRDDFDRKMAEATRLRALADEIEARPATPRKATPKAPDTPASAKKAAPSLADAPDLTGLTTRQKRARLKALGYTPEQVDQLAPTLAMQKKKATRSAGLDDELRNDELDDLEDDDDEELDEDEDEDEPVDEIDLALEHYQPLDPAARSRALAMRAVGHDVTPGHDELHHYWTRGVGLAKWVSSPKPWTTLVALLSEHVPLEKAKVFASRWFIEVFHYAAGSDLNRVTHGHPPRGHLVGPG